MSGAMWSAIAVAFTLAGVAIAGFGAWRSSRENAEWRNKVDSKNEELLAKSEELRELGERHAAVLIAKSEESAAKSDEIARLNSELMAYVSGADSLFYLHVSGFGTPQNIASIRLVGKQPVRDSQLTIFDITEQLLSGSAVKAGAFQLKDTQPKRVIVDVIHPGHKKSLVQFPFESNPTQADYAYFIGITNSAGTFRQLLHFVKVGEVWQQGYIVDRIKEGGKTLPVLQHYDGQYPSEGAVILRR